MTNKIKKFKPKTFFYREYKITRSRFGWRLNDGSFVFNCLHYLKKEIDFQKWLKEIDKINLKTNAGA